MLKNPKVGQIVVTIAKCNCYVNRHLDGVIGEITEVDPPTMKPRGIHIITSPTTGRWHCTKCLRLLTRKERRELKRGN